MNAFFCVSLALLTTLIEPAEMRRGGGGKRRYDTSGTETYSSTTQDTRFKLSLIGYLTDYLIFRNKSFNPGEENSLKSRFASYGQCANLTFDSWNSWRSSDGMLCRNDADCAWVQPDLHCHENDDVHRLIKINVRLMKLWLPCGNIDINFSRHGITIPRPT